MVDGNDSEDGDIDTATAAANLKSLFPATSFEFDPSNYDTSNIPMTNVVIPLSKLLDLIHSSFCCKVCRSPKHKRITIERYGIASSIYYDCMKCEKNKTSCRANLTSDLEEKWSEKPK